MKLAILIKGDAAFFQAHRLVDEVGFGEVIQEMTEESGLLQYQSAGYGLPGRGVVISIQQA